MLQTTGGTVVGAEDNLVFGPENGWVMEFEPWHTEKDRVLSERGNVELDVICVRTDPELDWKYLMGDGPRRNGTAVSKHQMLWCCFETEADGVGSSEGGVDDGTCGAGVDHCDGLDGRALSDDRHRKREMVAGVESGYRNRGTVNQKQGVRCGIVVRTRGIAQTRILYCV